MGQAHQRRRCGKRRTPKTWSKIHPEHAPTRRPYRQALRNEQSLRAVLSCLQQDAKRSRNTLAKINTQILYDHRLPRTLTGGRTAGDHAITRLVGDAHTSTAPAPQSKSVTLASRLVAQAPLVAAGLELRILAAGPVRLRLYSCCWRLCGPGRKSLLWLVRRRGRGHLRFVASGWLVSEGLARRGITDREHEPGETDPCVRWRRSTLVNRSTSLALVLSRSSPGAVRGFRLLRVHRSDRRPAGHGGDGPVDSPRRRWMVSISLSRIVRTVAP